MVDSLITIREAETISGYSPEYLRALMRKGEIRGEKKGWQWLISRDSLQDYLRDPSKEGPREAK